jgi:putative membrane protein
MFPLDGTWGMHAGWSWWWVIGPIMMVLFWGTLIWGVLYLIRRPGAGGRTELAPDDNDARAILRRRYARGDIDRDEFEQRTADLGRSAEP